MAARRHKLLGGGRIQADKRLRTRRRPVVGRRPNPNSHSTAIEINRVPHKAYRKRSLPSFKRFPVTPRVLAGSGAFKGSETLLVVGNTPALRGLEVKILRQFGYHVVEASDALDALRLMATHRSIHLVLIDLSSSEPRHFQLALWFRSTHPEIKVLVASDGIWDVNLELGIAQQIASLAKPFTPDELARMVRRVLDCAFAA